MLWQGCYRNPAKKGTFLSSYQGDILMEFRQLVRTAHSDHGMRKLDGARCQPITFLP